MLILIKICKTVRYIRHKMINFKMCKYQILQKVDFKILF